MSSRPVSMHRSGVARELRPRAGSAGSGFEPAVAYGAGQRGTRPGGRPQRCAIAGASASAWRAPRARSTKGAARRGWAGARPRRAGRPRRGPRNSCGAAAGMDTIAANFLVRRRGEIMSPYNFVGRPMRGAVAGASAARHAAALSGPVRGGVGQLDAAAASQPAAMADGCVAQHIGQVPGKQEFLLVHNPMLKPSRSIKMLAFMLLAVGRLDGDKRLEERRRNWCRAAARSSTQLSMPCSCSSWHRWSPCSCSCSC